MLALGLALATFHRSQVYSDEVSFWRDVAEKSPHNARAFSNLGYALAMACRTDDAERTLRIAFELDPASTQPVINLTLLRAGTLPGLPSQCAATPSPVADAPAPAPNEATVSADAPSVAPDTPAPATAAPGEASVVEGATPAPSPVSDASPASPRPAASQASAALPLPGVSAAPASPVATPAPPPEPSAPR
jgi:hypothetical protein